MAENETLDLRKLLRWNRARQLLASGAKPAELAEEVYRVLLITERAVEKLLRKHGLSFADVFAALQCDPDLRDIRRTVPEVREYLDLIAKLGRQHKRPDDLMTALLSFVQRRFFDTESVITQVRKEFPQYESQMIAREMVEKLNLPQIKRFAGQWSPDSGRPRKRILRKPPPLSVQDTLHMSLLGSKPS